MEIKELSPTEYELLTKTIYDGLIKAEGISNIKVQHNVRVKGNSEATHQIDVLWEHKIAGKTYKTFIECKHYKENVSIGKIRDFFGVLHDTGATGIFVTKVGFQSGAEKFASYYGIDTKLIKKTEKEDLEGRIQKIEVNTIAKFVSQTPPATFTNWKFSKESINALTNKNINNVPMAPDSKTYDKTGAEKELNFGLLLHQMIPVFGKNDGGPYEEKLIFEDTFLKVQEILVELKEIVVTYHISSFSVKSVSDDATEIYTHILKDARTGEIEYLKHRDGSGKKG